MATEIGTATIDVAMNIVDVKATGTNPRLRILELPMQHAGSYSETPFIFVFDRAAALADSLPDNFADHAKAAGAKGTLLFDDEINLE